MTSPTEARAIAKKLENRAAAMRALALIEPNGPPSKQLRQQDAELDEQAASAIEALTAERDRWHRVAMDAGAVVCVDGQIRFVKDSYKARAHAAEARNKELEEGLRTARAHIGSCQCSPESGCSAARDRVVIDALLSKTPEAGSAVDGGER